MSHLFVCPLHILKSLLYTQPYQTGPAAFLSNYLSCAKTKREEESKSTGLLLPLTLFHRLFHGLPPLVSTYYANYTPNFHAFPPLTNIYPDTNSWIHTQGETWSAKEAKLDQRPCVRESGYLVENSCPSLSLLLTLAWQQPEIWGLSRPLSWEKRTGQHTYTQKSFCLCSLSPSPSLAQTYKEERKPFVYAHSLIQPQIEIFVSHIHSLCHPHKTIKLSHAWFLFIVCLLNSFISCFSQFGAICLSILLCVCLSLHFSPALNIVPALSVN